MTPKRIMDLMEQMTPGEMTIAPGPFTIRVGEADVRAATLLKQLADENLTVKEVLQVLQAATWWVQLWASLPEEKENER